MYDPDATEYAGLHNPTQEPGCGFAVFRASDEPSLGMERGWWWDLPECRAHTASTPRCPETGAYQYARGPYPTSEAAYAAAMANHRDLDG
jgi:hypothetical protein